MVKTTIRKKNKVILKHKNKTRRNLPYTIRKMKGGDGIPFSVLSFNVLARNATHYTQKTRDLTMLDSDIITKSTPNTTTGVEIDKTRDLQPKAKPYEHVVDTARRFEKIKQIIETEKCDAVFLQEIDSYLFTYLNSNLLGYTGYYRFPPLGKDSTDLFGEFGTAIYWNSAKYTMVDAVPLDFLSYGIFNTIKDNPDIKFDINSINYPTVIGINTLHTLKQPETTTNTEPNSVYTTTTTDIFKKNNLENINNLKFTYPSDVIEYVTSTVKGKTVVSIDETFGKKPATFVRLQCNPPTTNNKEYEYIDLVCVHLNGENITVTVTVPPDNTQPTYTYPTNLKRDKMLEFINDFLSKIPQDNTILTVVGGDFNFPHINSGIFTATISTKLPNLTHLKGLLTPDQIKTTDKFDYIKDATSQTPIFEKQWIDHIYYKYKTNSTSTPTLEVNADVIKTDKLPITKPDKQSDNILYASDHFPVKATFNIYT